jgi:RNA polymerase sigma factor (sigma-70 family)
LHTNARLADVAKKSFRAVAKNDKPGHYIDSYFLSLARVVNENDATDLVTALFDSWYMSLVRYALRTTANYELAEDLAQETFMQLYQALRAGKDIEYPKAWTICVLRRAIRRRMQDRTLYEPLDELEIAGDALNQLSSTVDIRNFLSVLSPREEEVLLLRLEALKYREIAEQLGIGMNSVNTLLARALRKLQQAMGAKTKEGSVNSHGRKPIIRAP